MMFERASFHSAECDYYYETAEGDTQMSSSSSNFPRWAKIALYNMIKRRMNDLVLDRTAIIIMRGQRRGEKRVECVQGCKIDR